MLASACPGWVCYAEKTHGDYILPYISFTKSPQVKTAPSSPYQFSLAAIYLRDPAGGP